MEYPTTELLVGLHHNSDTLATCSVKELFKVVDCVELHSEHWECNVARILSFLVVVLCLVSGHFIDLKQIFGNWRWGRCGARTEG